jgi:hypothetical protein
MLVKSMHVLVSYLYSSFQQENGPKYMRFIVKCCHILLNSVTMKALWIDDRIYSIL